jgi:ribosomal protein S18 acetylase RimI-like enzyme
MTPADVFIRALRMSDIDALVALARDTWNRHYPEIISQSQIDYMLERRYDPALIAADLGLPDRWWNVAERDGRLLGFSQHERLPSLDRFKLDKLYVRYELRRQGIGSLLLAHVEQAAAALGGQALYLQVNRNNLSALAAYRKNGFEVADSVIVDIGGGFVMDDFLLCKPISRGLTDGAGK